MNTKKKLAAKILKTSSGKIRFREDALEDVKKAITRSDMRGLIAVGKIYRAASSEQSRGRARKIAVQKRKGRRKGRGSQRGAKYATVPRKQQWMAKIRVQRIFLKMLRDKGLLASGDYRQVYRKSKGGFFRNKRHLKLYLTEQQLFKKQPLISERKIATGL
ncbi:50S ribosomal protein L19e [Candidatus Woesearchaeota archaeon]|nr:50S ribosomal protein L19e [Candidatus Woesearchaeota archaeon]